MTEQEELTYLREHIKKSPVELKFTAKMLGIHASTLTRYLKGTRKSPNWLVNDLKFVAVAVELFEGDLLYNMIHERRGAHEW